MKPCVAHLKRDYLSRREPFVGYQIVAQRRFKPVVICRTQTQFFDYSIEPTFVTTSRLSRSQRWRAHASYQSFRHLTHAEVDASLRFLAVEGVSLLHAHYAVDAGFFHALKVRSGLPLVVSCYGYDTTWFASRFFGLGRRFLRRVYSAADVVLAMSPEMKRDLVELGCPQERIRLHYYGVETESFACPGRSYDLREFTILCVAALEEYKGHAYLLRALACLLRETPDLRIRLRLVGEGPLRKTLADLAQSAGVARHTEFAGFVSRGERLHEEYAKAGIFVMPSITTDSGEKEGIPGAMVEAMSAGLPVVASRHAGIPYVLEDGVTGLIVPERDSAAIAAALKRLITTKELCQTLGSQASVVARLRYDFRVRAGALEDIYTEQLERHCRPC